MTEKILIFDFGSQYTQLIGRRLRELNVYCEIYPYNKVPTLDKSVKGVILSGSPYSVSGENAPQIDLQSIKGRVPLLGLCYGAQYLAWHFGGTVQRADSCEYGRAQLSVEDTASPIFKGVSASSQVWMSHGDTITALPHNARVIASTADVKNAAFTIDNEPTFALQFHPEVYHSKEGTKMLQNFVKEICGCKCDWTTESFIENTVNTLKATLNNDKVVLGLSGGVDSSVAALLLHRAIGKNLHCIFVDNGLLRKNEFTEVLQSYCDMGLNIIGVDAGDDFLSSLAGVADPEAKRKIIGHKFIDVFNREAHKIEDVKWLAQGTIYPDVIESISVHGPSATIKSHHNVGGLPEQMHLQVVEPLRTLFKDEVRRVGAALGMKQTLLKRHPFPGPGLGIRVSGEVTKEKIKILQEADAIFINGLRHTGLYDEVWQAATILLPVKSVGVMGDERTYDYTIVLRAVTSADGMTADWAHLPYNFLANLSNEIINKVKGVNRVLYDISSKPPATIEWE
jgi:GMP synthase (glutamine-hydrolysing)